MFSGFDTVKASSESTSSIWSRALLPLTLYGSGKWIPLLPLSFQITARVNLAEPPLRRPCEAALRPDGAIKGRFKSSSGERFIPFCNVSHLKLQP